MEGMNEMQGLIVMHGMNENERDELNAWNECVAWDGLG